MGSVEAGFTLPVKCKLFAKICHSFLSHKIFLTVTEAAELSAPGIEWTHHVQIKPMHLKSNFNWMIGCCEDPLRVHPRQQTVRHPDPALARTTLMSSVAVSIKYQVPLEVSPIQQPASPPQALGGGYPAVDSDFKMITPELCLESFNGSAD